MELAAGGHSDGIWKLKTTIDTFHATSDVLSLTDESFIFDGSSEVGLQASTLCLLKDQVENKPSLLRDRNDLLPKKVAVTGIRNGTPLRAIRSVLLKGKRTKNEISSKTTQCRNVIRMQRLFLHNIRSFSTPYATVLSIHCSV
ncbi:hypothetical protein AVEN_97650-1 [Araneus ventricosus]|uniref:Uncharacterized protein n=1 Tax=Araneus ventricosus TaxID=182803 RepID=A0A4Y2GWN8_ARAVE|nr:hypothetical protein AVEN_97650-1 [Araneus ventricosus]